MKLPFYLHLYFGPLQSSHDFSYISSILLHPPQSVYEGLEGQNYVAERDSLNAVNVADSEIHTWFVQHCNTRYQSQIKGINHKWKKLCQTIYLSLWLNTICFSTHSQTNRSHLWGQQPRYMCHLKHKSSQDIKTENPVHPEHMYGYNLLIIIPRAQGPLAIMQNKDKAIQMMSSFLSLLVLVI